MIDMSNDSHLFRTRGQLEAEGWRLEGNVFRKEDGGRLRECLPLYEAKMVHQFDHRWATYDGGRARELTLAEKQDPNCVVLPRYWVDAREVHPRMPTSSHWLMGWRRTSRSTDDRTAICCIGPGSAVGDSYFLMYPNADPTKIAMLVASLDSFICDYTVRQALGGANASFFIMEQVAVLPPDAYGESDLNFIVPRVVELLYTAWDLQPFAHDCGWDGPPFRWDEERRFLLRAELDAAFFHLYLPSTPDGRWKPARGEAGAPVNETADQLAALTKHFPTPRDAVDYVLETFPIVKRKDVRRYGGYRTKRVILDVYDAMQAARVAGRPYRTRLDPPPADPRCRHPPREAAP